MTQPCIFVMGPTAAGKTDLALHLCEHLPCELISVDSALVYREMDIGTAKPSPATLAQFPHRLIDICDPSEAYSAAQFCLDAHQAIAESHAQGQIPLLVGGTGLYFRSLQQGLSDLPTADPAVRAQLSAEAAQVGWAAMHQRLATIDPQAAQRIHPNDPQRIQRALEVYRISGRSMSAWYNAAQPSDFPYPVIKIILAPPQRTQLHARIAQRFHAMLAQGFVEEVRQLQQRGDLNLELPALRAVGYRQIWQYLVGELDEAHMIERGIVATRQLAKRQLTWLRNEAQADWFDSDAPDITNQVVNYLKKQPMLSHHFANV